MSEREIPADEPETGEPESAQPELAESESTESEPTATESAATESAATESAATESAESEAAETESSDGTPPEGTVSPNRTLMIILSYLWILALIPFLTEEKDEEVKWHARHGLVLTGAEIVFWLGVFLLSTLSGFLGCLLMPLYTLVWIGVLVLHVACMVKGTKGERLIVPGVSQYADRL